MGNTHAKEARSTSRLGPGAGAEAGGSSGPAGYHGDLPDRSHRASRQELAALGLAFGGPSGSRHQDAPFEHRETRQEREARRLEKERIARVKERERSLQEEHVDGGYLVTLGIYTASEDFHKPIVRQLQVDRRLAPFWRGLDDFSDNWAEHQIIAAARGLEIPPADEVPEHLMPQPQTRREGSPGTSTPNVNNSINNLTVPMGPRTMSASSDKAGSVPGTSLPSPTSPTPPRSGLKPHKKALAVALNLTKNGSHTDITPREINLPHDPFVNGQPLEVFLYKAGTECPLCLMYYPPYLNRTRCCDQLICSECFVQIKRPDPHHPEHHGDQNGAETPASAEETTGELIMEPAKCPYCTQTEFGVTYEAPPFRRGLVHGFSPPGVGAIGTAMSSTSSLNSSLSPNSATPPVNANRRRAQSLSATAPGVITTDRIRPDWSTKLAAALAQQRRRAAAADALHHAAFVMGNNEPRTIFGRPSRFSRRSTRDSHGNESPSGSAHITHGHEGNSDAPGIPDPGPRTASGRTGLGRERIDAAHLENMMMAEAIRLSLADEEERRKKAEKEARKEAKKREKEERKAAKKASKGDVYGGSVPSSATASSLSLGAGGRGRGNSGAGNLRIEASVAAASASLAGDKTGPTHTSPDGPVSSATSHDHESKGKAIDRGDRSEASSNPTGASALPIAITTPASQRPRGSSHLRQMSNASSVSSSGVDSMPGSYTGKSFGGATDDPRGSRLSLGNRNDEGERVSQAESMFNFRSLAEVVGVSIDGDVEPEVETPDSEEQPGPTNKAAKASDSHDEHIEHVEHIGDATRNEEEAEYSQMPRDTEKSANMLGDGSKSGNSPPPHVVVTPDTPAATGPCDEDFKQLGHVVKSAETPNEVTQ